MTNIEYYENDILKLKGDLAINTDTGELCTCTGLVCKKCKFNGDDCTSARILWLCEEHRDIEETKRLVRSHITTQLNCDGATCKDCTLYALANRDKIIKPRTIYECQCSCLKTVDLIIRKGVGVLLEEVENE